MSHTSSRFPPSLRALLCHCGIYPNPVSGTGQALVIPAKSLPRIGIGAGIHLPRHSGENRNPVRRSRHIPTPRFGPASGSGRRDQVGLPFWFYSAHWDPRVCLTLTPVRGGPDLSGRRGEEIHRLRHFANLLDSGLRRNDGTLAKSGHELHCIFRLSSE